MARPLRVQHPGGWTHAMSRGINKQPIFFNDRDRNHFLGLLGAAVERFRIRLHAYVLMANHFHLLVEAPEGNLSASLKWIKQSYSMWYNLKHNRVGPLFQGRYKSIPIENAEWAFELSLYIHLNPLRLARFKLSRVERQAGAVLPEELPSRKEATVLRQELRRYPWSSYQAYGGYVRTPVWLTTETLLGRAGGKDRHQTYREAVQGRLTVGVEGDFQERLRDAVAVGSESFAEGMRKRLRNAGREIAGHHAVRSKVDFEAVIRAVEREMGETVDRGKRGGLGRDIALKMARDCCGLTLRELGERMGGLDYVSVHMAVRRLEKKLERNKHLRQRITVLKAKM
ncbi:MAG: transposase [Kiritimatiellia bacterium]